MADNKTQAKPADLQAFLDGVRSRQTITANWPSDYLYHPVDGGNLSVSIREANGQAETYSLWLKRDKAGEPFNHFVLLNANQMNEIYYNRPSADKPNTVTSSENKAWVHSTTGEVKPADVSEVFYRPDTGQIVGPEHSYDYYWTKTGLADQNEAISIVEARKEDIRKAKKLGNTPPSEKIISPERGELVQVKRAFVNTELTRDGSISASDLQTDLRGKGYVYTIPTSLVMSADSQSKAAAEALLAEAIRKSNQVSANGKSALTVERSLIDQSNSVSFYRSGTGVRSTAPVLPATSGSNSAPAMSGEAFRSALSGLSTATPKDIDLAKNNKAEQRQVSRDLTEIDALLRSDPAAAKSETQQRIMTSLASAPGYRDIISDFVARKIKDPNNTQVSEHLSMVTGRFLGTRPAVGSVANIQGTFEKAANSGAVSNAPSAITAKNLSALNILPTRSDLAEDFNHAQKFLDYIKASHSPNEPDVQKLPQAQITQVIKAYRDAGRGDFADIMEKMNREAVSNPSKAMNTAALSLNKAYVGAYEATHTLDTARVREDTLKRLNVDFGQIRRNISDILDRQNIKSDSLTEAQKDQIMKDVRSHILTEVDKATTPEAQEALKKTILIRVDQAIRDGAVKMLGDSASRLDAASEAAQKRYDDKAATFREQVQSMPPDQREKLCERAGSNPVVAAACKP